MSIGQVAFVLRPVSAKDNVVDVSVPVAFYGCTDHIERLIFGASDPKAGFCGSLGNLVQDPRLNHRMEVISGFEEERSRTLLQQFFQQLRKRAI